MAYTNIKHKIIIWDNDGTISASKDPNDKSAAKIILPNVAETMQEAEFNFIISGFKSPESEMQNYDPDKVIDRFKDLMHKLPINAAAFSPLIGGKGCYVVVKRPNGEIIIKVAHEDAKYKEYIGKFKKPDIGMFAVIRDIAKEEFGQNITSDNTIMIGDTWHDKEAAGRFGINFLHADQIHKK